MAILLVDVDGMFASCEQVFDPSLQGKPVIVLSNNDGCVVAANKEAKKLGLKMWVPWYKVKFEPKFKNVEVRSSNFELYSDLSNRMMSLLFTNFNKVEPYSIDEAFIEIPDTWDSRKIATNLKEQIRREIKLPVSIGVASTKTLAKIASRKAKQTDYLNGVLDISKANATQLELLLKEINIEDIWGIGRKLSKKMLALNIQNAYELYTKDPLWARHKFNIMVEQTVRELQSQKCLQVDLAETPHKNLLHSRLLANPTSNKEKISEVITLFVANISEKLNKYGRYTKNITLSIYTDRFGSKYVKHSKTINLDMPTNDQIILTKKIKQILGQIFVPGTLYNRVLIFCGDLKTIKPNPLIKNNETNEELKKTLLMINNKYGKSTINFGVAAMPDRLSWIKKQNHLSKKASTKSEEIIKVN